MFSRRHNERSLKKDPFEAAAKELTEICSFFRQDSYLIRANEGDAINSIDTIPPFPLSPLFFDVSLFPPEIDIASGKCVSKRISTRKHSYVVDEEVADREIDFPFVPPCPLSLSRHGASFDICRK